jgi:hypothetical protein
LQAIHVKLSHSLMKKPGKGLMAHVSDSLRKETVPETCIMKPAPCTLSLQSFHISPCILKLVS